MEETMKSNAIKNILLGFGIATSLGLATFLTLDSAGYISLVNNNVTFACTFKDFDGTVLYKTSVEPNANVVFISLQFFITRFST